MYARIQVDDNLEDLEDADLVHRLKNGDDEALDVLLRRHSDSLFRYCYHLTGNREDAEDICQESIVRAIDRVDSLQVEAAFRTWLFRIAKNLSVDSFRRSRKTCRLPQEEDSPVQMRVEGPQDRVEVVEEHRTVSQALGTLAESHRKVLVLREVEGLSYAAIARRLEVSQSAVETLLFRARRRLREEYSKRDSSLVRLAFLGGIRTCADRIVGPVIGGTPIATKAILTAAVVGSVTVAAPHVLPTAHHSAPVHSARIVHSKQTAQLPSNRITVPRAPALTWRNASAHGPARSVIHARVTHRASVPARLQARHHHRHRVSLVRHVATAEPHRRYHLAHVTTPVHPPVSVSQPVIGPAIPSTAVGASHPVGVPAGVSANSAPASSTGSAVGAARPSYADPTATAAQQAPGGGLSLAVGQGGTQPATLPNPPPPGSAPPGQSNGKKSTIAPAPAQTAPAASRGSSGQGEANGQGQSRGQPTAPAPGTSGPPATPQPATGSATGQGKGQNKP